jgi:hypothetical protein
MGHFGPATALKSGHNLAEKRIFSIFLHHVPDSSYKRRHR